MSSVLRRGLSWVRTSRPEEQTPAVTDVLAVICISDTDRAAAWYVKLLGRPADKNPMGWAILHQRANPGRRT